MTAMVMIYAKVQSGVVVNIQMISNANSPNNTLDPSFTWIDITNITCTDGTPVQIGDTYGSGGFVNGG